MGLFTATYFFSGERPALLALVEHVARLAREAVVFEAGLDVERAIVDLHCPAAKDELWLEAVEEHGQWGYQLSSTALGGSYLWDATAAVLRELGGEGPVPWRDVSNQPWRDAQAWYCHSPA
jgi:hypothetical protein